MIFQLQIEGVSHGAIELASVFALKRVLPPWGNVFFCPECSRVWASAIAPGVRSRVWTVSCENCPALFFELPGSIREVDEALDAALPFSVLERELRLEFLAHDRRRDSTNPQAPSEPMPIFSLERI